jgi:hypothetical protein
MSTGGPSQVVKRTYIKVFRNKDLRDFPDSVGVRSGVKRVKPPFSGLLSVFKDR